MNVLRIAFMHALPVLALLLGAAGPPPQAARGTAASSSPPSTLLARRYHEGDSLRFHMEASNKGRDRTTRYSADASGLVQRDSLGRFYEDIRSRTCEDSTLARCGKAVKYGIMRVVDVR